MTKTHTYDTETKSVTRNKRERKGVLSQNQKRKIFKHDMKSKNDNARKRCIDIKFTLNNRNN
jgi:hypothetical protein